MQNVDSIELFRSNIPFFRYLDTSLWRNILDTSILQSIECSRFQYAQSMEYFRYQHTSHWNVLSTSIPLNGMFQILVYQSMKCSRYQYTSQWNVLDTNIPVKRMFLILVYQSMEYSRYQYTSLWNIIDTSTPVNGMFQILVCPVFGIFIDTSILVYGIFQIIVYQSKEYSRYQYTSQWNVLDTSIQVNGIF